MIAEHGERPMKAINAIRCQWAGLHNDADPKMRQAHFPIHATLISTWAVSSCVGSSRTHVLKHHGLVTAVRKAVAGLMKKEETTLTFARLAAFPTFGVFRPDESLHRE
jgi:hypothetical protein